MPTEFSKTSKKTRINNGHYLEARCKAEGRFTSSYIDLDRIFGYKDGKIVPGGKNLSRDAPNPLKLGKDGLTVEYLDRYVGNSNGRLECEYGQDHCPVCDSFPRAGVTFETQYGDFQKSLPGCPTCYIIQELCVKLQREGVVFQATSKIEGFPAAVGKVGFGMASGVAEAALTMMGDAISWSTRGHGFVQIVFDCRSFVLYLAENEPPMDVYQFSGIPRAAHIPASDDASCLSIAHDWITRCTKSHAKCSSSPPQSLPSRVVDVGLAPSDGIHLLVTTGQQATYACLSHCWGASQTLTLRHDNIDTLQRGINEGSLQRVYREAISFCRRLGIRYIWIDSLCIIQGDEADWANEASRMGTYYSNCYVCLAATGAKDHDGRCSTSAPASEFKGTDGMARPWRVFARPGCQHIEDQVYHEGLPLLTRAWVYQERRLSPRVLHFCETELSFECNEQTVCLCGRRTHPLEITEWTKSRHTYFGGHRVLNEVKNKRERALHEWNAYVAAYSKLNLTFDEDRLPALSGLAGLVRQRRQSLNLPTGDYIAGLWKDCLIDGLTWCVGKSLARFRREKWSVHPFTIRKTTYALKPRPQHYIAPTWSWASVFDPIQYPPFQYRQLHCKILGSTAELATSDAFGRVRQGMIVLEACLLETRWSWLEDKYRLTDVKDTKSTLSVGSHTGGRGMHWWPDYDVKTDNAHQLASTAKLWLMPLASRAVVGDSSDAEFGLRWFTPVSVTETIYLVLKKHSSSPGPVYERVGWTYFLSRRSKGPDMSTAQEAKVMLV